MRLTTNVSFFSLSNWRRDRGVKSPKTRGGVKILKFRGSLKLTLFYRGSTNNRQSGITVRGVPRSGVPLGNRFQTQRRFFTLIRIRGVSNIYIYIYTYKPYPRCLQHFFKTLSTCPKCTVALDVRPRTHFCGATKCGTRLSIVPILLLSRVSSCFGFFLFFPWILGVRRTWKILVVFWLFSLRFPKKTRKKKIKDSEVSAESCEPSDPFQHSTTKKEPKICPGVVFEGSSQGRKKIAPKNLSENRRFRF